VRLQIRKRVARSLRMVLDQNLGVAPRKRRAPLPYSHLKSHFSVLIFENGISKDSGNLSLFIFLFIGCRFIF